MYIFGKTEHLSIHATSSYFKMYYFNDFQEAKTYLHIGYWKSGRKMTFMDLVSGKTIVKKLHEKWVHSHTQFLNIWLQINDTLSATI